MAKNDYYDVSLKAILKNKDGKTLILKADSYGTLAGFHDLPGGRIDEDEFSVPMTEILKREILEEVGDADVKIKEIPVAVGRHRIKKEHTSRGKEIHVLYVFYEAQSGGGAVKISEEHEGFEWVDLNGIELEKYFTSGILEGIRMYLKK